MRMQTSTYTIMALAMRYFFIIVSILIVIRAYMWLFQNRRARLQQTRHVQGRGAAGEFVVEEGNDTLKPGHTLLIPWEGSIGASQGCDIILHGKAIAREHAYVFYEKKQGLRLECASLRWCEVDGKVIESRHPAILHEGSLVKIGEIVLRVHLFLDAPPSRKGLRRKKPRHRERGDADETP